MVGRVDRVDRISGSGAKIRKVRLDSECSSGVEGLRVQGFRGSGEVLAFFGFVGLRGF